MDPEETRKFLAFLSERLGVPAERQPRKDVPIKAPIPVFDRSTGASKAATMQRDAFTADLERMFS